MNEKHNGIDESGTIEANSNRQVKINSEHTTLLFASTQSSKSYLHDRKIFKSHFTQSPSCFLQIKI